MPRDRDEQDQNDRGTQRPEDRDHLLLKRAARFLQPKMIGKARQEDQ